MNLVRERRRIQRALVLHIAERRRLTLERRRLRDAHNPFEYEDYIFVNYFRASKEVVIFVSEATENVLKRKNVDGLSVQLQVLVAIRFMAEGGYQRGVGQDFFLAVSQPSVSRCVKNVTRAICDRLYNDWIKLPSTNMERNEIQERFRPMARFPGVLGAIDCTHVAIVTPLEGEEGYKNHKGFYSLNAQMICDSNLKIMDVCIYPGTVHDQFIWRWSRARIQIKHLHENGPEQYYLLGNLIDDFQQVNL
ncbi:putative nuclease HARBI1 [Ischnura elegans]|uniref:putative nuclease HARBI1 n=1 Tax=Ischnura elegans TaxID=197161 RepID=UPI001ED88212|nr:putative nuclease HARBI1 [Ischnura elegans]